MATNKLDYLCGCCELGINLRTMHYSILQTHLRNTTIITQLPGFCPLQTAPKHIKKHAKVAERNRLPNGRSHHIII
jgi:hypothetical protein